MTKEQINIDLYNGLEEKETSTDILEELYAFEINLEDNKINDNFDILENLKLDDSNIWENNNELLSIEQVEEPNTEKKLEKVKIIEDTIDKDIHKVNITEEKISFIKNIKNSTIFLIKYISTSSMIFILLMWITNYSSYKTIALSYLAPEKLDQKQEQLYSAIESNNVSKEETKEEKVNILEQELIEKIKEEQKDWMTKNKTYHSMSKLLFKTEKENINLDIEIAPYENRVVIPKIWKNIPLIDVRKRSVKNVKELEQVFMDELVNWIVRYPWSAIPGKEWNSFIFWHSSNFPWMKWQYNDVFALLDKVVFDDEVIVYYDQKKYIYKIREKRVIRPGEVDILQRNKGKAEITLMTCWPVWTTLNRLIVIWELVEEKNNF